MRCIGRCHVWTVGQKAFEERFVSRIRNSLHKLQVSPGARQARFGEEIKGSVLLSEFAQSLSIASSFVHTAPYSAYFLCAFSILAQESRSDTVWLKTSAFGSESTVPTQK